MSDYAGPDVANFPDGVAAAPVEWNYLGDKLELEFKAGFVAATQDVDTGMIRPMVGWFLSKRMPKGLQGTELHDFIEENNEDDHVGIYEEWDASVDSDECGMSGDDDGDD